MEIKILYILYSLFQEVRIIEDNSTKTLLSDLDSPIKDRKTEFYLYGLDTSHGEGKPQNLTIGKLARCFNVRNWQTVCLL